jgi:hypothetical protein
MTLTDRVDARTAGIGAAAALSGPDATGADRVSGTFVVTGYLTLAILGVVPFGHAVGDGSIAPNAMTAVLLAGAIYPAVFGALGGAVRGWP